MKINFKNSYLVLLLSINSLASLALSAFVVKIFGVEFFGKYSYTFNLIQIAITLALMGTDNLLIKETSVDLSNNNINAASKRFINIKYATLLISSLICFLIMLTASFFLQKTIIIMLIALIPLSLITLNHSVLKAFQKQALVIITDKLLLNLSLLALTVILYYLEIYEESFFTYVFLSIICLNYFLSTRKNKLFLSFFPNSFPKIDFNYIKKSKHFFLSKISTVVIKHADIIILGTLLTPLELGVFAIISKLVLSSNIFMSLINSIESPVYAALYEANKHKSMLKRFYRTSFALSIIGLLQLVTFLLFKSLIFSIWKIDIINFNLLIILMIGQLINLMSGNCGVLLNMTGNDKPLSLLNLSSLIIYIPSLIYLTISNGLLGSVYAICFYNAFTNIVKLYLIKKNIR